MKHSERWRILFVTGIFLWLGTTHGASQNAVDLHQTFLDLTHDGVVMEVSAHPDDEDGATLAYYRMKYGVKTYSLFFTRGEGGQNEKGPELYEELGVLRTVESEEAARIQGTEVRFLNFYDFGYSKSAGETFRKWGGRTEALRRLVFVIRKLKPDVIFTNHNTVDGHGHHQAVSITVLAAFEAAAESTSFPEQLREPGVTLWQPKKLFVRNFGRIDQTADVVNHVDEVNLSRGKSYTDIANDALRMHKTQGLDRIGIRRFTRGVTLYRLLREQSPYDRDTTTFFGGVDVWFDPSLLPLKGTRSILSMLRPEMPRDSVLLVASRVQYDVDTMLARPDLSPLARRILNTWNEELARLVSLVCDVQVSFTLHDPVVVPRQKVDASLTVRSASCRLGAVQYRFALPGGWTINEQRDSAPEISNRRYTHEFAVIIGETPLLTLPRTVAQYSPIELTQDVVAYLSLTLDGHRVKTRTAARFDVAPPHVLTMRPRASRIPGMHVGEGKKLSFEVKNYFPHKTAGRVTLKSPAGWRADFPEFAIAHEDSIARGQVTVWAPPGIQDGHHHLKFRTDYSSDSVMVRVFDVQVPPNLHLGIVKSYDNTLETTAEELGVRYALLDEHDLERGDLSKYHTIVVDIRAYLVREDLTKHHRRILEYVHAGGNLVVMYQRDQEWKPDYAPYRFVISRRRITNEQAPVDVLQPMHPLLNKPNRVSDDDWSGWIQERGLYFPDEVDSAYTRLVSSHDPDEAPLNTGYLVARAGKGSYIYTSYVWYRQLKEMHPGAYRCFANMMSYAMTREW